MKPHRKDMKKKCKIKSINNILTVKVKIVKKDDLFLDILIAQFHSVKFINKQA